MRLIQIQFWVCIITKFSSSLNRKNWDYFQGLLYLFQFLFLDFVHQLITLYSEFYLIENFTGFFEEQAKQNRLQNRSDKGYRKKIPLFPYKYRLILYTQFDFKGRKYLHYPDKVGYIELTRFADTKLTGRKVLFGIGFRLLHLNPLISFDFFKRVMYEMTIEHFEEEYRTSTIEEICDYVCDKSSAADFTPQMQKRSIVFNPEIYISPEDKKRINLKLNVNKKVLTLEHIKAKSGELMSQNKLIDQKVLASELGVSVRTIATHYPAIKDWIKSHNSRIEQDQKFNQILKASQSWKGPGKFPTDLWLHQQTRIHPSDIAKLKPRLIIELRQKAKKMQP